MAMCSDTNDAFSVAQRLGLGAGRRGRQGRLGQFAFQKDASTSLVSLGSSDGGMEAPRRNAMNPNADRELPEHQGTALGVAQRSRNVPVVDAESLEKADETISFTDPSAAQLGAMLMELISVYRDTSFQTQVAELRRTCAKTGVSFNGPFGVLALKVQAPILRRYGFPPSAEGVDLFKHSVQRRVSEGSTEVEELANEARRLLGIQPLPDRTASAEVTLSAMVDTTAKALGFGGGQDTQSACKHSIDGFRQSGVIAPAMADFLTNLLHVGASSVSVSSLLNMAKLGLSTSMLCGADLPNRVPVLYAPTADAFFQSNVLCNKPAVIRQVFDAGRFPPLSRFADFDFLRQTCGHRRVFVKSLAHNDQDGRPIFVTDPGLKLPFSAFLDHVEAYERGGCTDAPFYLGKVPLRAELPELARDIEAADTDPGRTYGSCFGQLIPDGVFTYFGCGRNTTAVHYDMHENLMLCICGTKRVWLYPPSDALYLYPVLTTSTAPRSDFSRSAVLPFAHLETLPAEIRARYPRYAEAHGPIEIFLEAGDMLYLPSCWWHCVEGSEDRNIILNWWFSWHPDKIAFGRSESHRCGF